MRQPNQQKTSKKRPQPRGYTADGENQKTDTPLQKTNKQSRGFQHHS